MHASRFGLHPQVVAVLEHNRTAGLQSLHRLDLDSHRAAGPVRDARRVQVATLSPLFERIVDRAVAEDRVMRSGEIGDDVRHDTLLGNLAVDRRRVAYETNDTSSLSGTNQGERFVEVVRHRSEVTALQRPGALLWVDLDHDATATCHRDGQRLRRAHAAEPGGEDEPAVERPAEVLLADRLQELVDALENALESDVLPVSGGEAPPHDQSTITQLVEVLRRRVVADDIATGHHDKRRVR